MDKMTIEKLREMLCKEIDDIGDKGTLSAGALDSLHKLTDTVKNLDKIEMLEQDSEAGYGRAGYSRHYREDPYEGGNSYRRNSMGRYSRADAQEDMTDKLRAMMQDNSLPERYRETARMMMRELR